MKGEVRYLHRQLLGYRVASKLAQCRYECDGENINARSPDTSGI